MPWNSGEFLLSIRLPINPKCFLPEIHNLLKNSADLKQEIKILSEYAEIN